MSEYFRLWQFSELYGVGARQVARWLSDLGFKGPDGRPTDKAFVGGYVALVPDLPEGVELFSWHAEKTTAVLDAAGHRRAEQ